MGEQQKYEIIKALAYGETPEQAAAAEDLEVSAVRPSNSRAFGVGSRGR